MKVKTFDSIDEVHKIWNDETWILKDTDNEQIR